MEEKIISLEMALKGENKKAFIRLMSMTPKKDRNDKELQRLVAFRLKIDGEDSVRAYLKRKMANVLQCQYEGSFYRFLKDDEEEKKCSMQPTDFPDEAG